MVSVIKKVFIVSLVLSSTFTGIKWIEPLTTASANDSTDPPFQGQAPKQLQSLQSTSTTQNSHLQSISPLEPADPPQGLGAPAPLAGETVGRQTSGLIWPSYESLSPLPARGVSMYYNPGIMQIVVNYRMRIGQLTACSECVGYIAMLRKGDINRRVWLQFEDGSIEGPFLVADVAATRDIPRLLSLNWAVDVDYETAVRWRFRMRYVTVRESAGYAPPSYNQLVVDYPNSVEPVRIQPTVEPPSIAQSVTVQPVITQPVITQPVITQPVVEQPTIALPSSEQPVAGQPSSPPPSFEQSTPPQPAVEPHPAEAQLTEPQPVEPQPIEPQPVEPQPVEPQPVEPQPVEPIEAP